MGKQLLLITALPKSCKTATAAITTAATTAIHWNDYLAKKIITSE